MRHKACRTVAHGKAGQRFDALPEGRIEIHQLLQSLGAGTGHASLLHQAVKAGGILYGKKPQHRLTGGIGKLHGLEELLQKGRIGNADHKAVGHQRQGLGRQSDDLRLGETIQRPQTLHAGLLDFPVMPVLRAINGFVIVNLLLAAGIGLHNGKGHIRLQRQE